MINEAEKNSPTLLTHPFLSLAKERDLKRQLDISFWVSGGPFYKVGLFIAPAMLVAGTKDTKDTDNERKHLTEETL